MALPEHQLVDQHRTKGIALRRDKPLRRHPVVPVEDRFKLFIEILIGNTTEFVKDAAHLRPVIRGRAR